MTNVKNATISHLSLGIDLTFSIGNWKFLMASAIKVNLFQPPA